MTDANKAPAVFDAPPEAKPQSFAITEMNTCAECLRSNPPTRTNCLYCGAQLSIGEYIREPQTTPEPVAEPESIGPGFHVVLVPGQAKAPAEVSLTEIAALLQLQPNEVESAFGLNRSIPLLRAATFDEGKRMTERLRALGIEVRVLPEEGLELDLPTRKIRSLQLSEEGLTAHLTIGGPMSISWSELSLMVAGRLLVSRRESEERQGRRGSKPVDSRELFSDEPVVDLYRKSDAVGFRISVNSFDFSCLGDRKAMTAFENLATVINLVKTRAPGIEFDDSYRSLRTVLNNVWPLEPQTRKGEWRRSGVGKVDVSTITILDNENQFNTYSRLRQQIKSSELEGKR